MRNAAEVVCPRAASNTEKNALPKNVSSVRVAARAALKRRASSRYQRRLSTVSGITDTEIDSVGVQDGDGRRFPRHSEARLEQMRGPVGEHTSKIVPGPLFA
jgi:hypothetical protein